MVNNGQRVSAEVTNAAFMSRTSDTSTTGKVDVNNATDSTAPTDGALHTQGGLGVEKSANIGQNLNVGGELIVAGESTFNDTINATNILADGNINAATGDVNALNLNASANVTALNQVSAPSVVSTNITASGTTQSQNLTVTSDASVGGNLTVSGTLTVSGGTTNVNSTNLNVTDKNITVNNGGNDASSEGAGLTVKRTTTDGSLIYKDASATKWAAGSVGSEVDLVGTTSTQAITNKDIDGGIASNSNRLTLPKNTTSNLNSLSRKEGTIIYDTVQKKPFFDDGTNLVQIGSGAGSGGGVVNLITDGDANNATASIFTPYADAAASRPVDGTGGSPTVTTSITTTNPLTGSKSFLLTKPASNTQGQGWSVPFSVDLTYRAKVLQISVDYIVNSGTFAAGSTNADSDVIWYLYDITNSLLIEPSSIKMLSNSSTLSDKFQATFQTSVTGASYRLIAHCATTSASAYELKVDSVSVSPNLYVYGTPVTVWREFTPTFTGMGTVTNIKAFWRRVGQNLEVYGRATTGTVAANAATITFSALGVNIDTSLIVSDATRGQVFGEVQRENADSATFSIGAHSTFTNYVYISDSATQGGLRDSDGSAILASGEKFSFKFSVPILGWSASAQQSDNYEGREISGQVTITSNLSMTANNPIIFPVITKDSVGSYNVSTGQVRIPSAGEYEFTLTEAYNNTSGLYILLYKNGTPVSLISYSSAAGILTMSYPAKINCNAGDLIDVRPSNNTNQLQYSAYTSGTGYVPKFSWKKNQGSQAISASEKVFASYTCTTGQSITSGSNVTILFNNKLNDSHGVYNTSNGRLTLPRAGVGYINATYTMSSAAGGTYWATIFKNGSLYKNGVQIAATTWGAGISTQVEGLAGDYFEIRANQSGSTRGLDITAANNHFDFRMD